MGGLDVGGFAVEFPVYTLVVGDDFRRHGPASQWFAEADGYGRVFPLFSDRDLALQFVAESGVPGLTSLVIPDRPVFLSTLMVAVVRGVEHVGIDCPADPNPRKEAGRFTTVRFLAAALLGFDGTDGRPDCRVGPA